MAISGDNVTAIAVIGASVGIDAKVYSSDTAKEIAVIVRGKGAQLTITNSSAYSSDNLKAIAVIAGPHVTFLGLGNT